MIPVLGRPKHSRTVGWWLRRVLLVSVIGLQVFAAVHAYDGPHKVFGWQMFNASSDWQAEIVRVTADGERYDVREPWPGGYTWSELVSGRGLGNPFVRHHASNGLASTFDFFQHALDWVAGHTPDDTETVRIEAEVIYWENGRGPFRRLFVSGERVETSG